MIAASMTTATAKDLRDYELFSPATVGALSLSHRVVHAPMTRLRAEADLAPSPMMVETTANAPPLANCSSPKARIPPLTAADTLVHRAYTQTVM
jgi:hypothetical protein